ncbi:DUF6233 domain-containing protein [Streptomyces sp. NPDC055157]
MEQQLTIWIRHVRAAIAAAEQREADQRASEERRPPTPDWIIELGIGQGALPSEVHVGYCHAAGKRRRVIDRDQARALLADGICTCAHCRPDTGLRGLRIPSGALPLSRRRFLSCGLCVGTFFRGVTSWTVARPSPPSAVRSGNSCPPPR